MIEMMKKAIITRPREKASPLIAELDHYGVLSYVVPVTQTVFSTSVKIPDDINEYNYVAFTSANAVSAFSQMLTESGLELKTGIKIAAVGSSTAAASEKAFGKTNLVPGRSDGESLAKALIERTSDPRKLRVFWPCAADALPDFEKVLSEAGAAVTRWECYRTKGLDPQKIGSQLQTLAPWDLVFFAAPSAVKAFADAWENRCDFMTVAIGPTTAKALKKAGYDKIVTSKGTSVTECAGAIIDALGMKVWS